ncbi:MAG: hypothetical protein FWD57_16610, partial [Polyangiaceae bacterium]|nr:hypothetical protein [Polyangiaceae bacterium]
MMRLIRIVPQYMCVLCFQTMLFIAAVPLGCTDRGVVSSSDLPDADTNSGVEPPEAGQPEPNEFVCVSDWPTQESAVIAPSLDLPRLTLVGVDKSLYRLFGESRLPAFSAGRIAKSGDEGIVSYDISAGTFVLYQGSCFSFSAPAIRRDMPGGFVTGSCQSVFGFFPDLELSPGSPFGPDDGIDWIHPLGQVKYKHLKYREVSSMLVDSDGILYFTAADESFKAIWPNDGSAVWVRDIPIKESDMASASGRLGIADRLFFGDT